MAAFGEFLALLLGEGKVAFGRSGRPTDRPTDRDLVTLEDAHGVYALSVAGPPVAFDANTACEAAELVRQASWALVDRTDRPADLARWLRMASAPTTPARHLSADLTLRYLPQVLVRARAIDPTDPLIDLLSNVLRGWPLSGVLSDVEEGPLRATDLCGHPGLLLLYAERLAAHDRPKWRPDPSSPAYDYYQLVLRQTG